MNFQIMNSLIITTLIQWLCLASVLTAALATNSTKSFRAYFNKHDVALQLGSTCQLPLYIENELPSPILLNFTVSKPSVLITQPSAIFASAQSNYSVNVTLVSKTAGNTVVYVTNDGNSSDFNMNLILKEDVEDLDIKDAYVRASVAHNNELNYISDIIGWIYFAAWSISFYPQIYLNFIRRSVIGLNLDFLALNVVGFMCYSVFNCGLYFSTKIVNDYYKRHPYGVNPVQLNDVIFSLHALFACLIQVIQCCKYDRGQQRVSMIGKLILACIGIALVITSLLSSTRVWSWLDFLYFISYIKLGITLIKYIPQVYYNYLRRSTVGWSLGNVLLDMTGGLFSILQMFLIAYNYDDFSSIFGDFTKFGLGAISISFDVIFIFQHVYYTKINRSSEQEPLFTSDASYDGPMVDSGSRNYGSVLHSR